MNLIWALCSCLEQGFVPPPAPAVPSPVYVTDLFVQEPQPVVDILWVLDDSPSMHDQLDEIFSMAPAFLDWFVSSGLDYHIGVISTDTGERGELRTSEAGLRWLDPQTPEPHHVLLELLADDGIGSSCEQGLTTSGLALQANEGFLRDDSAVHVIIVSDEVDQSDPDVVTSEEYVDWFTALGVARSFSAVADSSAVPGCGAGQWSRYADLVEQIGGVYWELGRGDWDVMLDTLGLATSALQREFVLSQPAVPDSLQVSLDATQLPSSDYWFDPAANSIVFYRAPPWPAEVRVTYAVR
jgi:hypothetical protein